MKKSSIIYSVLLVNLLYVFAFNVNAQTTSNSSPQNETAFVTEKGVLKYTQLTQLERTIMMTEVIIPKLPKQKKVKKVYVDSGSSMSIFDPSYTGNYFDQPYAPVGENPYPTTGKKTYNSARYSGLVHLAAEVVSNAVK